MSKTKKTTPTRKRLRADGLPGKGDLATPELSMIKDLLISIRDELFDKETFSYKDEVTMTFIFNKKSKIALSEAIRKI